MARREMAVMALETETAARVGMVAMVRTVPLAEGMVEMEVTEATALETELRATAGLVATQEMERRLRQMAKVATAAKVELHVARVVILETTAGALALTEQVALAAASGVVSSVP